LGYIAELISQNLDPHQVLIRTIPITFLTVRKENQNEVFKCRFVVM
jgi:hypothetical protein